MARNALAQSPSVEGALATLRSQIADLPSDAEARRQQVAQLIAELRLSASVVADFKPRLTAFSNELQAIDAEGMAEAVTALDQEISEAKATVESIRGELERQQAGLEAAEAENQQLAHLALLVGHGEAYGLDHGHCPLCAAERSEPEFRAAIDTTKRRLAEANNKVAAATAIVEEARSRLREAEQQLQDLEHKRTAIANRIASVENERQFLTSVLVERGCAVDPADGAAVDRWLMETHQRQIRLQDALLALDSADTSDRVGNLEKSADSLRNQIDSLAGDISAREVVSSLAKRLERLTKSFPNEILAEQFDAVMPLMKEFYRRLRPHTDWDEIEYDFGGRIRATLNFYVADRRNPQFLFSSGQRRATGLAFLLAVHLARHWANLRSLVLDDPVQHIDDYRALNLVEVLAAIRRTGHQVVVAVEDAALAGLLTRRLRSSVEQSGCFYELGTAETGGTCVKQEYVLAPLPLAALTEAKAS